MITLRCPFQLKSSHGRNAVGLGHTTKNVLTANSSLTDVLCCNLRFHQLTIESVDEGGLVKAEIDAVDEAAIVAFLDQFEVALTARFGFTEDNAYSSTVFVEFDRTKLELIPGMRDTMSFVSTVRRTVSDADLKELRYDAILQLYADGLRASMDESKYFHWFIILEEFLEKSTQLNAEFAKLFTEEERRQVAEFAAKFDERRKGNITNALRATEQNRQQKLTAILERLGVTSVISSGKVIPITVALSKQLIEQRHALFHRGGNIDLDLLYNVLFPIVTALARRSGELLAYR